MQVSDGNPAMPPLSVIKWWYEKDDEQRRAFLAADNISEKVQQNIRAVECFAEQHSYYIMCETKLAIRPLPPLSPQPNQPRSRAWLGDVASVWLPCPVHAIMDYGGRYQTTEQREARRKEAERLISIIYSRTASVLHSYCGAQQETQKHANGKDNSSEAWRSRSARILVDVLVEASVAALCRLGLTDELEAIEKQKSSRNEAALEAREAPLFAETPKPVGACRAEAWGCLGLWEILQSRVGDVSELVTLFSTSVAAASGAKRPRVDESNSSPPEGTTAAAKPNQWKVLREVFCSLVPGTDSTHGEHDSTDDNNSKSLSLIPCRKAQRITITAADVRCGIAKVLKKHRPVKPL
ncbi:hypothetical protein, conserved [Trypanosoma brucei gambiense DAL972]|uniref:Uncharacterized protein n=2 Tax=Trypanosoma brucei TaxID=5691 RepID=D0A9E5_TRYB9|nr:hypothetical protein, conserved [Trypanosoma brucei gambiense DAL972]RHW67916.1 hypothetical protein DPX39_110104200 [Trypanosoma brucei equiperdum]CBH18296.1 hypothetical protein, conserved [Trypanosoma brucei gambiense DAL972]|eukprot:XP_011780560.1 hypothetical protein, conserved [Trypanosoma brucei gambiense DAL972]